MGVLTVFLGTALLQAAPGCLCGQTVAPRAGSGSVAAQAAAGPPSQAELDALAGLPHYQPLPGVTGTIRLWGHGAPGLDFMGVLVKAWEEEFHRLEPGITLEYDMYGTASAMGALYSGAGDIAILGQEMYPFELTAFRRARHYDPTQVEIATGSVDVRNFDFALGVFVQRDNPLGRLTLEQMRRVFAYQDNPQADILTWDQLGLTGDWVGKPIHLYGWRSDDVFSTFLQHAALEGNHRWRCDMKEFSHIHNADGSIYDSGQQSLDLLSNDRYGMAVSNLRYVKQNAVKPLALATRAGQPYYEATRDTLIAHRYPLGRYIPAVIDREPGQPVQPAVLAFLRYLISREGQTQIVRNGRYLPISPATAQAQQEKLR